MADPRGPGVVEGTENDDTIDNGYTDGDGDSISTGNDLIFGEGGGDTIHGSDGNDTIHGDSGVPVFRELFQWALGPGFGDGNTAGSFTQDTGNANITFSRRKLIFPTCTRNCTSELNSRLCMYFNIVKEAWVRVKLIVFR